MSVLQGFGQPNLMPAPNIPNPQSSNVAANNTLSTLTALGAMGECAVVYLLHVGVFSDILELCCILRCFKHCQVNFCLNGFTIRIILFFFWCVIKVLSKNCCLSRAGVAVLQQY